MCLPSTVVGTVLPPPSDTSVQVPGGAEESSQPVQNIPVGSSSVAVVPTVIPTVISGSSTSVPAVIVGSTTLTAGQTAVVDNTPIMVPTANDPAPQGTTQGLDNGQPPAIIIGSSSTITLPTAVPPPPSSALAASLEPPTLTLADGQTITPSGPAYIVSGQTLAPDSPALTFSGTDGSPTTIIALTTNALGSSIILIGPSSTIPYPPPPSPALPSAPAPPTLTLANGQTLAPSGSAYVVSGATLAPGSPPFTLGRDVIALTTDAAGAPVVVVDGSSTVAYASPAPLVVFGSTVAPGPGGARWRRAGRWRAGRERRW
ncbi:hypothetical protein SLS56_009161 [Neofusicoccum ribis]|uniref:Uncharacterized protein n=1 Tax=Neofusicoccum ribis TaxID=45134 RepID=A0ABR3SI58_9PEZI